MRKTAHVFGAISLDEATFSYRFAPVFSGHTFHEFLEQLVEQYAPRKVFLVIDNGPCHWLDGPGKAWLAENAHRIELHRLPPYSPELNPIEEAFSKIKGLMRKAEARSREALLEALGAAISALSAQEARGFFEHCGYRAMVQLF